MTFLCCLFTERLSEGTKVAIGASVVVMFVALVGGTMLIFYCKRKQYMRPRGTLIDDNDDYRL